MAEFEVFSQTLVIKLGEVAPQDRGVHHSSTLKAAAVTWT
jgi:hypothetical protein